MKKGFTLIELLAVIVILAIIALIATPIVLNIINDTKESAVLRSADFYLKGVETAIATSVLNNKQIPDGTYEITKDGNVCIGTLNNDKSCTVEPLKVEMDGEKPTSGTITIVKRQISDITLNLSNRVIVKNDKGELVLGEPQAAPVCKLVENGDVAPAGISPGDKYQCKVKDDMETGFEDGYYFYVLSQEGETTNLIMDRNICEDGTVATAEKTCLTSPVIESDFIAAGGTKEQYQNCHYSFDHGFSCTSFGPITVMNHLYKATKDWINIPNIEINYADEGREEYREYGYGYGDITTKGNLTQITKIDGTVVTVLKDQKGYLNLKARIPYYIEVKNAGYNGEGSPQWIIDNLDVTDWEFYNAKIFGYWTPRTQSCYTVPIDRSMTGDIDTYSGFGIGVRPVINIPTNQL